MIPKILHYCWFGGKPLPAYAERNIRSWRRLLPDFEIVEWNERNFDVGSIPYAEASYEAGKYAFVSDYARYEVLYREGGIYLDTDVEVVRPLDDIIARGPFLGIERDGEAVSVAPGLIMGACAGMEFYREMTDFYGSIEVGEGFIPRGLLVSGTTDLLVSKGFVREDRLQRVAGMWIYPNDYFNPMDDYTGRIRITENTRTIHHYAKSWADDSPLRTSVSRCWHRLRLLFGRR